MLYLAVSMLCLFLFGSVFFFIHSLKENKKKREAFYSEILPIVKEANVKENKSSLPSLDGVYENYKIKIVPVVDNLCYRGLPRLYVRIYLLVHNEEQCRIVRADERKHLFPPANFENHCIKIGQKSPVFEIFLPGEEKKETKNYNRLVKMLMKFDNCSEILIQKKFIRLTLLLARGKKSYYAVLRSANFPVLILKNERFNKTLRLLLELREEILRL